MTHDIDDTGPENDLELRRRLSAAWRQASDESTSPALDAAILAQARAAVPSRAVHRARRRRWIVPLGLAATLVLGMNLLWQLGTPPLTVEMESSAVDLGDQAPSSMSPPQVPRSIDVPQPAVAPEADEAVPPPAASPPPPPAAPAASAPPAPAAAAVPSDEKQARAEAEHRAQREAQSRMLDERRAMMRAAPVMSAPAPLSARPASAEEPGDAMAQELLRLLRGGDIEALVARYPADDLSAETLSQVSAVLAVTDEPQWRRLGPLSGGRWYLQYLDGEGRPVATVLLRAAPDAEGWRLQELRVDLR